MRRLVMIVAAVLLLGGCSSEGPIDTYPIPVPQDLVHIWRVDAPGETDATWLSLGEQATLWSSCGIAIGTWRVSGSAFIAGRYGSVGRWCSDDVEFPSWLQDATSWSVPESNHVILRNSAGETIARLSMDGAPPTSTDAPSLTIAPTVTPGMAASFRSPAPLPKGVEAAVTLTGRWTPNDAAPGRDPFVEFDSGNNWNGSDGCNGAGGRWALGSGGLLLTTAGASTGIGCDNSRGPEWVATAARAGMVDGRLTLYDAKGAVLGSFSR